MSHRRRSHAVAPLWTLLAVAAALLVLAAPVAAKEGASIELTTKIPRDATPGSTLAVEWDAFIITPAGRDPIYGSPIFIRLVAVGDGIATEAEGHERLSGSGHYAATIEVPATGIAGIQLGWRGERCDTGKACVRDDLLMAIVGTVMTDPADPAAAKVAPAVPAATSAASAAAVPAATVAPPVTTPAAQAPATASNGVEPGWLAAGAVMILAVVGLLAASRLIRRRGGDDSSVDHVGGHPTKGAPSR